jgi:thiol-disulfide isomerase/thioredoxin
VSTFLKLVFVAVAILAVGKLLRSGSLTGRTIELPLDVRAITGSPAQPGKPTILEFWATWCGPCRQTIPHLNQIYNEYQPKGLQIVGLTKEDAATVLNFQKQVSMRYPVAQDEGGKYSKMFGIRGIPAMALLDANGMVIWQGHPAAFRPEEHLPRILPRR